MIKLYHFFTRHKPMLYGLLIVSSLLFIWLGSKVEYEEDISKLLPSTHAGSSEELAFANLKVKDKIFLLFIPKTDSVDAEMLTERCDEFIEGLLQRDSAHHDIQNILYRIEDEWLQNGLEYVFANVPTFIDTTLYPRIEELLTKEAIEKQMAANYELVVSPTGMAFRNVVRQDPIGLRTLFMGDSSNGSASTTVSRMAGNYAMVNRHLFTPDTTVELAFLAPNFKAFDSKTGTRLIKTIEAEITAFNAVHSDTEILFHGAPVQSVFNSRQIKQDLALTMGISLLLICLIIGFCFRNKSTLPLLLMPVAYGTFFALACIYVFKGGISLMAVGVGAIVLGVALSYCLHVLTHYKYVSDPVRVLKEQTRPVILGCLTTIGAFMGLLLTRSALLQDFGLFASLAMVGTTFFCLFFLPHFFNPERNKRSDKAFAWLERINSYPLDRQKWLIVAIAVICVICIFTSRWVTFDSDLKNIGYTDANVKRSNEILAEKTTQGNSSVYYATTSHNLDSAITYSRELAVQLDSMQKSNLISSYSKASALLLPEAEQQLRIRRWHEFWTAERIDNTRTKLIEAGKVYKFKPETFDPFFEMLKADVAPESLYEAGALPDELMANIVEYTDSTYMIFTSVQMSADQKKAVSTAIAAQPHRVVIDPFFYTSDMVELLHDDFNRTLGISSIFVFIVLLLSFRKPLRAILAFLPMALSWYVVLGVMGIFGLQFNLINIVISTFIFGIGVDYSIFVMDGLLADSQGKDSNLLMYHKTAIFFSFTVMIIGIASLMFATHPAIRSIGLSTLIGMTSTVLITYTIQPFLFRLARKKMTKKIK